MNAVPRVAFFSDSFHEVNGVALTSRQLEAFARRRGLPFFSAHAGSETHLQRDGTAMIYDLQRSGASLSLEADSDLSFDMLLFRYRAEVMDALREFKPDLIHVTGPGDLGLLGAWVAHELKIPLAASWHTNVHEYAGRRLEKLLAFLPEAARNAMGQAAERGALSSTAVFYKLARVLFAPNQELVDLLRNLTGSPCFLMQRGVDAQMYSPEKRPSECATQPFTIGYVGRLSVEKNVRLLVDVEKAILAAGHTDYRFLVIGPGGEDAYLREHMQRLELPGVLRGEDLARAYASMDVFANRHLRQRNSGGSGFRRASGGDQRRWPEVPGEIRRNRLCCERRRGLQQVDYSLDGGPRTSPDHAGGGSRAGLRHLLGPGV